LNQTKDTVKDGSVAQSFTDTKAQSADLIKLPNIDDSKIGDNSIQFPGTQNLQHQQKVASIFPSKYKTFISAQQNGIRLTRSKDIEAGPAYSAQKNNYLVKQMSQLKKAIAADKNNIYTYSK
jgi:hypothetical protein